MGYAMFRPFKNQYALICCRISCSLVHKVKKSKFCFLPPICPCLSYTLNPFLRFVLAITVFLICAQYFWTILKSKEGMTPSMSSYILLFPQLHKTPVIFYKKNKKAIYHSKSSFTQSSITFLIFWEDTCFSCKMTVWKGFQSKCF